jgi:hypothetical protein
MHPFYKEEANKIRGTYGDFILINTNFNHVNAFSPIQNLFQTVKSPGEEPQFGRAAKGMTREYAEGFRDHKQAIFESFQELIPALDHSFPDYTIIVRPHPTESPDIYNKIAARCKRVRVTNEGNVVPWLIATKALIHNGCTTGVEAYAMGVPAISYRAAVNDFYDFGFYRLPNLVSHQCFSLDETRQTLEKLIADKLGPPNGGERRAIINHYLAALSGPLACERVVDVIEQMVRDQSESQNPGFRNRLEASALAAGRTMLKRFKAHLPGSHNRPAFQRHRYPQISLDEIRTRIDRFQKVLGDNKELKSELIHNQFFRIRP